MTNGGLFLQGGRPPGRGASWAASEHSPSTASTLTWRRGPGWRRASAPAAPVTAAAPAACATTGDAASRRAAATSATAPSPPTGARPAEKVGPLYRTPKVFSVVLFREAKAHGIPLFKGSKAHSREQQSSSSCVFFITLSRTRSLFWTQTFETLLWPVPAWPHALTSTFS